MQAFFRDITSADLAVLLPPSLDLASDPCLRLDPLPAVSAPPSAPPLQQLLLQASQPPAPPQQASCCCVLLVLSLVLLQRAAACWREVLELDACRMQSGLSKGSHHLLLRCLMSSMVVKPAVIAQPWQLTGYQATPRQPATACHRDRRH